MANEDGVQLLALNDLKEDQDKDQDPILPPYVPPTSSTAQRRDPSPVRPVTITTQPPQMGTAQQMSNTNTVVVTGQPTSHLPPVTVEQRSRKPSQGILIFSLVMVSVCPLVCNIPSLFILIPGVVFALVGFHHSHSKDPSRRQCGRGFNGVSLCCSVTALVSYVVAVLCTILFLAIYFGILNQNRFSYTNDIYNRPSYYYPYCSYSCQQQCLYSTCSSNCYCN